MNKFVKDLNSSGKALLMVIVHFAQRFYLVDRNRKKSKRIEYIFLELIDESQLLLCIDQIDGLAARLWGFLAHSQIQRRRNEKSVDVLL